MSNPVDKKFNEKQKAFAEQICWDMKTKEFYIKRTFPKTNDFERHELSEWGLKHKVETCIIIIREVSDLELEHPTKLVFYKLPLVFEIKDEDEASDWFLHEEIAVSDPDDQFEKKFKSIIMKNINSGQALRVPIPNELYKNEYTWLKIVKGKSIRINKEELEELLQTGEAMCIMDMKLEKRMVS